MTYTIWPEVPVRSKYCGMFVPGALIENPCVMDMVKFSTYAM